MEPRACAFRYLRGWAIVDVLSVLPFDLMLIGVSDSQDSLGISFTSLPRCLKLLRLPRLFRCVPGGGHCSRVRSWSARAQARHSTAACGRVQFLQIGHQVMNAAGYGACSLTSF